MEVDETRLSEMYRPRIFYFLLRRLRDRCHAEEMTQEVLLAVIQALRENRVHEEDKLPAFIFGIVRNLLCKAGRQTGQEKKVFANGDPEEPVAWSLDPEAEVCLQEQMRTVRRALERMSPDDGDILRRSFVEAGSIEKIASDMGIGYAAARKRKSRALERLRALFVKMSQKGPS